MTPRFLFVLLLITGFAVHPLEARQSEDPFAWDDATIYRVVTDRFSNGDSDNDGAYGRGLDGNGTPYDTDSLGHFLGGDFAGITGWIEDGYFARLGVNTLQISAPYEQVHGWTGGSVQRYAFDGSMPLDYTVTDDAFGTSDAFARLVSTAHEAGLRVLIEVRLAAPGGPTLHDMVEMGFGDVRSQNWRSWRPADGDAWSDAFELFADGTGSDSLWAAWWGPDWVRADYPGYDPCEAACPPGGVKFRTEADSLSLPPFLVRKWGEAKAASERRELDAWFERTGHPRSAAFAVVKWISDWVRDYGLDGIVVTDASLVEPEVLMAMDSAGRSALAVWRALAFPASDAPERPFWLVADDAAEASTAVRAASSASVVDAAFGEPLSPGTIAGMNDVWSATAAALSDGAATRSITTLRSDGGAGAALRASASAMEADPGHRLPGAAALLLTPGPVSMLYGTETGRLEQADPAGSPAGRMDEVRLDTSPMNWITLDEERRDLWQSIGAFRAAHPAVARGGHEVLTEAPLSFFRGVRIGQHVDRIVVVLGARERTRLNVARIWPDDVALRDAMTGNIALVTFGQVTMTPGPSGILLIEEVPE